MSNYSLGDFVPQEKSYSLGDFVPQERSCCLRDFVPQERNLNFYSLPYEMNVVVVSVVDLVA